MDKIKTTWALPSLGKAVSALADMVFPAGPSSLRHLTQSVMFETATELTGLFRNAPDESSQRVFAEAILVLAKSYGSFAVSELSGRDSALQKREMLKIEESIKRTIVLPALEAQGGRIEDSIWGEDGAMMGSFHVDDLIENIEYTVRKGSSYTDMASNIVKVLESNQVQTLYGVGIEGITIASIIWNLVREKMPNLGLALSLTTEDEYFVGESLVLPRQYQIHGTVISGKELVFGYENTLHSKSQMLTPFTEPIFIGEWAQHLDTGEMTLSALLGVPHIIDYGAGQYGRRVVPEATYIGEEARSFFA